MFYKKAMCPHLAKGNGDPLAKRAPPVPRQDQALRRMDRFVVAGLGAAGLILLMSADGLIGALGDAWR